VTTKRIHRVQIVDHKLVGARFKSGVDLSPEFSEVWQARSSHPNDEVGTSDICPLDLCVVSLVKVFELIFNIALPGDVGAVNYDWANST